MQLSKLRQLFVITLITWAFAHSSIAACSDTSNSIPAKPLQSEHQQWHLDQISNQSMLENQTLSVSFSGTIDRTGKLNNICCFSAPYDQSSHLRDDLVKRLKTLRFEPAVHQNELASVFAHITVETTNSGDGVKTNLSMRQPISTKEFGADYLSPQRLAPRPLWSSGANMHGNDRAMWGEISVNVKRDGSPSDAQVGQIKKGSKRKFKQLAGKIKRECFLPGFVEGKAVDMPYTEVFHNIDR